MQRLQPPPFSTGQCALALRLMLAVVVAMSVIGCGSGGAPTAAATTDPPTSPQPTEPIPPQPPPVLSLPAALAWLQAGQWAELPGTQLRALLPDPLPRGDPAAITLAWSGGTVDQRRSRLVVWGGGHNDYLGNELYAIDLPTLSALRLTDPSPFADAAVCDSSLKDGTPAARHTYDGLTYVAPLDRMVSTGGSMAPCGYGEPATWAFDFSTHRWDLLVPTAPMRSHYGTMAVYDPGTQRVLVKDGTDFYSFDPSARSFSQLNPIPWPVDYRLSAALDTKRRKVIMLGDGVQFIDLATNTIARLPTHDAPSLVTSRQAPGVEYDEQSDRIVAWHGGSDVWALNMDTLIWTQVATNRGPGSAAPYQGTFGRWGYVQAYGVFLLVNSIDENAWVFRLRP